MALDLSTLDLMAEDDRRRVAEQYGNIGNQLTQGYQSRGLARSGFAQEGLQALHGQEQDAYGQVEATDAARKQQYQEQQDQIAAQAAQQQRDQDALRHARRRKKKKRWLGGALSALAIVAAPFTGGASLAALPATLAMTAG